MEKRNEQLSHRLDGFDVKLEEIKEGIKLLLASSQMNTNGNDYEGGILVDNRTQKDDNKSVDDADMTESWHVDIVKKKRKMGNHLQSSGIDDPPPQAKSILNNQGQSLPSWDHEASLTSHFKRMLEKLKTSGKGPFSLADAVLFDAKETPTGPTLHLENVMERYATLKKYDTVSDHSDHLFSSHKGPEAADWVAKVLKEWKDVEEQLPENMFVRAYEGRPDLLRVVIIGPKGTPYHDGLFFFDVCFPSTYPDTPPLVCYYSRGLSIHPHVDVDGSVGLILDYKNIWVPGTSGMVDFLRFLQGLFNPKPLLDGFIYRNPNLLDGLPVLLYNEVTFIKSVKTMVTLMKKPPKDFEDLVVGHFRSRVDDILKAHKAYAQGVQVGRLAIEDGDKGTVSSSFKSDLDACRGPLVDAFKHIGAEERRLLKY